MNSRVPQLSWLENPEVFAVNRLPAHSDHRFYESEETMETGEKAGGRMPLRQCLNGTWKFSYAENPSLRKAEFYQKDFDDSDFHEIQVPGHIQLQGYDKCQYINTMYPWDGHSELRPPEIDWDYNPVGSYVREFDLEKPLSGKRVILSFQGAETAMYVWLNGVFVGYGEDSFTPSEFDVTPWIREQGNRLAVEVYKRSSASWIEDQDFFRFSGIFRDVYLYGIPDVHLQDLFVNAGLEHDYQDGRLKAELSLAEKNSEKQFSGCRVAASLKDRAGKQIWASEACVPDENGRVVFESSVSRVHAWSSEDPYCYMLYIEIRDGEGRLTEIVPQKIGFRTFEMKDQIMCLNGKRLVWKGINRHEFDVRLGRSITEKEMLWDIRFLKQHNLNAVRTCHYPNQSRWYELCDEYGIYLIDEANLESHGSWQKMGVCEPSWNVPGSLPQWKACVVDRARSMLERDKNHPSVLVWSCGNESYAGEDILAMSRYFKERDSSRLVHYEGVFWNREFDEISDMESRMYAKPQEVEEYLKQNPKKPFILCEYMHAMGNSLGGMEEYTRLAERYPMYQGGFIWDYIDQALVKKDGEKEVLGYGGDFTDRPTDYNFCGNGIVYGNRTPSPKAAEAKALYQNLKLTPEAGQVLVKNENLFTDTSDREFVYRILKNGNQVYETRFDAVVKEGEEKRVPVDLPEEFRNLQAVSRSLTGDRAVQDEYVYQVSALLKEDTLWAEKGFETDFGETLESEASGLVSCPGKAGREELSIKSEEIPLTAKEEPLTVIHGDVNLGVKGRGFSVLFSRTEGGIVSLRYGEKEWIARAPMPTYWRASTDNDRGNHFAADSAAWMAADQFCRYDNTRIQIEESENQVTVTYRYGVLVHPETETRVTYTVGADGKIQTSVHFCGKTGLPQLPLFGMRFRLLPDADRFSYYGYGPEESYPDRKHGVRLGIFYGTPEGNMASYLIPQECGNRSGVRWMKVLDSQGNGLKFTAAGRPLDMNVLPYTALELEQALHEEELPVSHNTIVTVLGAQRGVGGDDSWGAPVHRAYEISGEKDIDFHFVIEGCRE